MTADTVGGVWTYALELCRALNDLDIQVHLATMGDRLSDSQWQSAHQIQNLEIIESDYALEWMDGPWEDVDKAGRWLMELEQYFQPDLIHLNNFAHGNLPWNAPALMVGHSCVLSWWLAVKGEEAPDEWNHYKKRVKSGLQQADYVVGVSSHLLEQLRNIYGPFPHSEVIYNARSADDFYPSEKENVIFSMGRLWDEAKNIYQLKKIANRLDWPVYVAGEGEAQSKSKNITFLGQLSETEVAKWLGKSRIYVMPARYEPFGLSVLEAALCNCALVLGDIPTLREVWKDAALYADPEDPEELQSQIQSLTQNNSQRISMADKARQRAGCYSPDQFAEQYLDVYQKLMSADLHKPLKKASAQ